jgi:hypothetical protein
MGLESLEARRIDACDRCAKKRLVGRFKHWFSKRDRKEGLRKQKPFREDYARTDSLKNTPVYYIRRRLNKLAEEGKLE